ncbi:hypothetical protein A9404_10150 [Halothiobacillus diazotrophicus]|uniref:Thioredoxin domain-containing protein n=1 Tax=Halothiobacillus diazotrophicus TaxID=1860122 RepID=A0A191ZIJ0_9GAMM|nr:thioredoxin family protein [Halothiobacillus diazotrophicus]ANJ67689.1 hypothetical protein A9404_10150 [Halothiobacillus diazotrophicus]
MLEPTDLEQFNQHLQSDGAVLVLFGGAHCGVCQVIKPKLESLISGQFPDITLLYVDCERQPGICGQSVVFSLPTVKLFLDGQLSLEKSRSFSLMELERELGRLIELWRP